MSFRGIPAGNDARYTNAEKKLLQSTKFPAVFQTKVDTTKVNFQVLGPWINKRVTELLGIEDEVVIELVNSLMEERYPDPKKCQITLTGFLEKSASIFMQEFWEMMISAQDSMGGIPAALLEAKKAELQNRRVMEAQISNSLGKRMERRLSTPVKSQEAQQQSMDDYERPLRMREPGRHDRSFDRNDRASIEQRSGSARVRSGDTARGNGKDVYYANHSSRHEDKSESRDVIDRYVRTRATHDDRRLSPVAHNERHRERSRHTSGMSPPRRNQESTVEPKRRRSPSRSSQSTPPRRRRQDSVDSVGRRKRARERLSSRSPKPRSRSRERRRISTSHRTRSTSSGGTRTLERTSAKESRPSRRSDRDHSPGRHKSHRSSNARRSPRRRSRSRSGSRDGRSRRSRHKDRSRRRHRSPTRSRRTRRRRSPSTSSSLSSSLSSSSSQSRSRSARRRRTRRARDRSRSRSSTPPRRQSPFQDASDQGLSKGPPLSIETESMVDDEAQHRENVLKAKLLRQKRMAELKKAAEASASSEGTAKEEAQILHKEANTEESSL